MRDRLVYAASSSTNILCYHLSMQEMSVCPPIESRYVPFFLYFIELTINQGTHANLLNTAEDGETTYSSCDAEQHAACCDPVSLDLWSPC